MATNQTQIPETTTSATPTKKSGKFTPQWIGLYVLLAIIAVAVGYLAINQFLLSKAIDEPGKATNFAAGGQSAQSSQNPPAPLPSYVGGYNKAGSNRSIYIALSHDGTCAYVEDWAGGRLDRGTMTINGTSVTITINTGPLSGHSRFELRENNSKLVDLTSGETWSK